MNVSSFVIWATVPYKSSARLVGFTEYGLVTANCLKYYSTCAFVPVRFHCGSKVTGSPGIICIGCHQVVCHPSEHGTTSNKKHFQVNAHIVKLNAWTESEVTKLTSSTIDETALAILRRQGSRGITTVSLQRKIIFDIPVDPSWLKWQTKLSKLADKHFEISEFHQHTWNCYLMLGFVPPHIPCNSISNLELRRSHKALCDDLVQLSATTIRNICRSEYALTVDAIRTQLPTLNKLVWL